MAKSNLKTDDLKKIKTFKESFLMYEKTKKETEERMREAMNADGSKRWTDEEIQDKLKLIQTMQDEVRDKYLYAGGHIEDLVSETTTQVNKTTKKTTLKVKKPTLKKVTVTSEEMEEQKENITITPNNSTKVKPLLYILSPFSFFI